MASCQQWNSTGVECLLSAEFAHQWPDVQSSGEIKDPCYKVRLSKFRDARKLRSRHPNLSYRLQIQLEFYAANIPASFKSQKSVRITFVAYFTEDTGRLIYSFDNFEILQTLHWKQNSSRPRVMLPELWTIWLKSGRLSIFEGRTSWLRVLKGLEVWAKVASFRFWLICWDFWINISINNNILLVYDGTKDQ